MTTRACKRCQVRPGVQQTRTAVVKTDDDQVGQVLEHTSLCEECRGAADQENVRARGRTSQSEPADLRDLFW